MRTIRGCRRAAVNRLVVSSNLTAGAILPNEWPNFRLLRTTPDDAVRRPRDCYRDCQVRAGQRLLEEVGGLPLLGRGDVGVSPSVTLLPGACRSNSWATRVWAPASTSRLAGGDHEHRLASVR